MENIKYPLANNTITREDLHALASWLTSDPPPQLTMGPLVQEYEHKWSRWLSKNHVVACHCGSCANHLMYYTLLQSKRLKNKKVIVPSAAWHTTITPAIHFGFEPIMCEADYDTWALNKRYLKELLEEHKPSTVMLVHVLGVPHDMDNLMELKKRYGFFLLEDACAAIGSSYHGRKVGTFGDMASVSTYYGHQIPTIEGGAVFTDDKEFHKLLLMLRSHGWVAHLDPETRADELKKRDIEDIGTHFHHIVPGFNFRFTDIFAFLGLRQLDRFEWNTQKRYENHKLYKSLLYTNFMTQVYDEDTTVCSIHFCALADSYKERNFILKALTKSGIETRPFTNGNQGLQPYWYETYKEKFSAPMADKLFHCGFFLPNHPYLQKEDIEYICSVAVKTALDFRKGGK